MCQWSSGGKLYSSPDKFYCFQSLGREGIFLGVHWGYINVGWIPKMNKTRGQGGGNFHWALGDREGLTDGGLNLGLGAADFAFFNPFSRIKHPQFRNPASFAGASGFAGGVFLQLERIGKRFI